MNVAAKAPPPVAPQPDLGVRLILLYKLVKASFGLGGSVALFGLIAAGQADRVADMAAYVRHHVTAVWALELVNAVASAADKQHLELLAAALALDGAFVLFEWYALRTGRSWGSWLVVLATASLLPFEAVAIARHARAGRIVLFAVNLAIVFYLARRSHRKHGSPWVGKGGDPGADSPPRGAVKG